MVISHQKIDRFIGALDSLTEGEEAVTHLVEYGPIAIEPLRRFLLEGRPRKIFQPRYWVVRALARLGARDVLLEYLCREREIPDPEDRFGEEAVASAAACALAAWPDEEMFRSLLKFSERRMLNGLIEALAEYNRTEAIPYFEHALEDDFYRPAAEKAFQKLGNTSCAALALSAVTPRPGPSMESPSSLKRRRSAIMLLNGIGMDAKSHWKTLRKLIHEPDEELMTGASKLGINIASKEDRMVIAHRLINLISSAPWHLQEDIEDMIIALKNESIREITDEIEERMAQPKNVRARDKRFRALLRIKRRFGQA